MIGEQSKIAIDKRRCIQHRMVVVPDESSQVPGTRLQLVSKSNTSKKNGGGAKKRLMQIGHANQPSAGHRCYSS
jgi:hypothetical protein